MRTKSKHKAQKTAILPCRMWVISCLILHTAVSWSARTAVRGACSKLHFTHYNVQACRLSGTAICTVVHVRPLCDSNFSREGRSRSAEAAAAAARPVLGWWRGSSRAEPPRRSPTPRRARRLPLPCAPSRSAAVAKTRRVDLWGTTQHSSCRCSEACGARWQSPAASVGVAVACRCQTAAASGQAPAGRLQLFVVERWRSSRGNAHTRLAGGRTTHQISGRAAGT